MVYYAVDTPDGSLCRDVNGYYTEAPLRTSKLKITSGANRPERATCHSLRAAFGNDMAQINATAALKVSGNYSTLILMMECGACGYESPVETQSGEFVRTCCCCGATNQCERGTISVHFGLSRVQF